MSERRRDETPNQRGGVTEPGWFQRLQAFEDAIAYRRARVALPCPDCETAPPGQRCDDHARDLELIAEYLQTVRRSLLSGPEAVEQTCLQAANALAVVARERLSCSDGENEVWDGEDRHAVTAFSPARSRRCPSPSG
jgi:hypothetical protein